MSIAAQRGLLRRDRVFDFLAPAASDRLDTSHGTLLYLENVSVSFERFSSYQQLEFLRRYWRVAMCYRCEWGG